MFIKRNRKPQGACEGKVEPIEEEKGEGLFLPGPQLQGLKSDEIFVILMIIMIMIMIIITCGQVGCTMKRYRSMAMSRMEKEERKTQVA